MKIKIVATIFLFFCIFSSIAQADSVGISVDQSVFALAADPGTTQMVSVNVSNTSNYEQKMSAVTKDFVEGDNGLLVSTTNKNDQFGMKDWVNVDEKNWILAPSETKKITLNVTIPKDATVGAHYAIVDIRAFPEIDGQNFQSTIVGGQIGVYLLFNVNGAVSGSGNLKKFDAPVVIGSDSVPLKAEFENTGNILYIPHGEIKIQNILTKKISTIESEKHFVFPGAKYSFEMAWDQKSIFGFYRAQAVFVDANGAAHIQQRFFFGKLFFVIPLLLLVAAIFAVIIFMKKRKPKKLKVC